MCGPLDGGVHNFIPPTASVPPPPPLSRRHGRRFQREGCRWGSQGLHRFRALGGGGFFFGFLGLLGDLNGELGDRIGSQPFRFRAFGVLSFGVWFRSLSPSSEGGGRGSSEALVYSESFGFLAAFRVCPFGLELLCLLFRVLGFERGGEVLGFGGSLFSSKPD